MFKLMPPSSMARTDESRGEVGSTPKRTSGTTDALRSASAPKLPTDVTLGATRRSATCGAAAARWQRVATRCSAARCVAICGATLQRGVLRCKHAVLRLQRVCTALP
jgi:hypothetical protein